MYDILFNQVIRHGLIHFSVRSEMRLIDSTAHLAGTHILYHASAVRKVCRIQAKHVCCGHRGVASAHIHLAT